MSVQTTRHRCGGVLVFTSREQTASSEYCATCGWWYEFAAGQPAEAIRAQIDKHCRKAS